MLFVRGDGVILVSPPMRTGTWSLNLKFTSVLCSTHYFHSVGKIHWFMSWKKLSTLTLFSYFVLLCNFIFIEPKWKSGFFSQNKTIKRSFVIFMSEPNHKLLSKKCIPLKSKRKYGMYAVLFADDLNLLQKAMWIEKLKTERILKITFRYLHASPTRDVLCNFQFIHGKHYLIWASWNVLCQVFTV